MTQNIIQDGWQFFVNLFENLRTGILFFGGPYEIILALLDIFITTVLIYFGLKLIRDSRAWQLLKGILLIVILSQLFTLMGLQTIGYILTNAISIIAIAVVVLFQPELRRALETVGRNSFTILSGVVTQEIPIGKNSIYSMIDSIVRAAEKLVETNTGALIIIERETKLGEIAEQDNAVLIDSVVSSTLLLQIFYKGSPLHDGAVLIRNGRIIAARCHVPLSDNYHLRKDYGTRHRAAIGVSEMGDAIAVVVSEERSVISIAVDGRLYTLDNADALRTILHKQLDPEHQGGVLSNLIKNTKIRKRANIKDSKESVIKKDNSSTNEDSASAKENSVPTGKKSNSKKFLMIVSSLLIAFFVWLYVQNTVNPVVTKTFTVTPITVVGTEELKASGFGMGNPDNTVTVTLMGRSKNMVNLTAADITAYIDVTQVKTATIKPMPVLIKIKKLAYYKTTDIYPPSVSVDFTSLSLTKGALPTPTPTLSAATP